jgi:sugar phosphate isomerase/epimerase
MENMWSCLPVSLFKDIIAGKSTVEDWAKAAKDMGLDAVDISILFVRERTPRGIQQIRDQLSRGGLPLKMITCYPDFTQPDDRLREYELTHALSDIAVCAALGGQYLRITAGQVYDNVDESKTMQNVVACFEACVEKANRFGVELLLENHAKPGAWERPDFDFHTGRFLKLVELTGHLPIGINFDTANTYALGDDVSALFEKVYPRIRSIHVNDIRDTSKLEFVGIGDGGAPIKDVFTLAKEHNFSGLLSIEEAGHEGYDGIKRSFERSKKLWADA